MMNLINKAAHLLTAFGFLQGTALGCLTPVYMLGELSFRSSCEEGHTSLCGFLDSKNVSRAVRRVHWL